MNNVGRILYIKEKETTEVYHFKHLFLNVFGGGGGGGVAAESTMVGLNSTVLSTLSNQITAF